MIAFDRQIVARVFWTLIGTRGSMLRILKKSAPKVFEIVDSRNVDTVIDVK